jgi:hypothetical protein
VGCVGLVAVELVMVVRESQEPWATGDGRRATGSNRASPSLQAPILLRLCVPTADGLHTMHIPSWSRPID